MLSGQGGRGESRGRGGGVERACLPDPDGPMIGALLECDDVQNHTPTRVIQVTYHASYTPTCDFWSGVFVTRAPPST